MKARRWAHDTGVNSRQPLDRLQYVFALCDPVILTFDLILNGGRGLRWTIIVVSLVIIV